MGEWRIGWVDEWMDRLMIGRTDVWIDEWIDYYGASVGFVYTILTGSLECWFKLALHLVIYTLGISLRILSSWSAGTLCFNSVPHVAWHQHIVANIPYLQEMTLNETFSSQERDIVLWLSLCSVPHLGCFGCWACACFFKSCISYLIGL